MPDLVATVVGKLTGAPPAPASAPTAPSGSQTPAAPSTTPGAPAPAAPSAPPAAAFIETPKAPDGQPAPSDTPAITTPAAPGSPAAAAEPAKPASPEADATAIATAFIKEKGARKFFESLPDEIKEQVAEENYKGLHRLLSQRDARIETLIQQSSADVRDAVEKQLDEFVMAGMNEDEKKAYLGDKDRKRSEANQAAATAQTSRDAYVRAGYTEMWRRVVAAGFPLDPNNEMVKQLDWDGANKAQDLPTALGRLEASIVLVKAKAATTQPKPAAGAAPATPAPDAAAVQQAAEEIAARIVAERMAAAGVLRDTGRPGAAAGAGGTGAPKTIADAFERSKLRLAGRIE